MKPLKALAVVGFFVGAMASSQAQIVHLKLETTAWFRGEYVNTDILFYPGTPLSIDIYYEADLPDVDPTGEYGVFDTPKNGRNGFRLEVAGLTIQRSLDRIYRWGDTSLLFITHPDGFEYGEFMISFWGELGSPHELPIGGFPPLSPVAYTSYFFVGPDIGGNTGPNAAQNFGEIRFGPEFTSLTVEIVPVPEPSAYGAAALALLAGLVAHRRWRKRAA